MDVLPSFHLQGLTKIKDFQSLSPSPNPLRIFDLVCKPAFTEAAFVSCHTDAFAATVTRLDEGLMEVDINHDLHRSSSHVSNSSKSSLRSQTLRGKPRKFSSYASSTTSSIAASDKSLTSFPSFSPDRKFPDDNGPLRIQLSDGTAQTIRKASGPEASIVDDLTAALPSQSKRDALFDDEPPTTRHVPGAIHLANDEHIERLIARNGAVALVRQIAEDLAQRDSQIAVLRRKAEERERALRKITLECGLSNLELETRLRTIEDELKANDDSSLLSNNDGDGLEDLIQNAMTETMYFSEDRSSDSLQGGATIRASDPNKSGNSGKKSKDPVKGWKDYIWGNGASRRSSTASSINGNADKGTQKVGLNGGKGGGRRTVLQNDVFQPPETGSIRSSSRASSLQSGSTSLYRNTSLAALALKLVAGNGNGGKEADSSSSGHDKTGSGGERARGRSSSSKSSQPLFLAKNVKPKPSLPRIPSPRRATVTTGAALSGMNRIAVQDRWDTMGINPQSTTSVEIENSGPVEMDAILPLEAQPPTLTTVYNNHHNPEFLTDRFGFIYDQRRKKRQREAAETLQKIKGGDRYEGLSSAHGGLSPASEDGMTDVNSDMRPDTPASMNADDTTDSNKTTKRWQDYLKIATVPTELLSHTPLRSDPGIEVLEADDLSKAPSPGFKTGERGFVPANTIVAPPVSIVAENATISTAARVPSTSDLTKDDLEPVKLLLEQLSDVHDALQREKTTKWNEFLRKVRAERKREGEAAAAAAETRSQRGMAVMPEATLTDGEMIGVAGLGNKGKVGRAKWNDFKALVLGGIPVAYRAKIWAECSGATALRVPGYYDDLVAHREDDDPVIIAQIKMDINRTLTDNIFFRRGPGVSKLKDVLIAYSRRNPEVGYCQGMNLITACLLLIMPAAEDAFWILTSMIENILPQGYYDHSLLSSRADQQVLRQYVAAILPRLSAHLDALSIELEALTFQWFLSVFTDCLSAEALFRVWDVVLCINDGSTFLFEVALALLKLNERQLLQCQSPASVYTYINHQMTNHAISIDGLIHASEGLRKVVKREDIEARRKKAIKAEKDLARQREARNNLRRRERAAAANLNGDMNPSGPVNENVGMTARAMETRTVTPPKSLKARRQLELGAGGHNELTIHTPLPVEERQMALG